MLGDLTAVFGTEEGGSDALVQVLSSAPGGSPVTATAGSSRRYEVASATPSELWLLGPASQHEPAGTTLDLHLAGQRTGSVRARTEVTGSSVFGDVCRLRVKVWGPDIEVGRTLLRLGAEIRAEARRPQHRPFVRETIVNPRRIASLVRALVVNRCSGVLLQAGRPGIHPIHFEPSEPLPLLWTSRASLGSDGLRIALRGPLSVLEIEIDHYERVGGYVATPLPKWIVRTRRRWWRRAHGSERVEISFRHPQFPELTVEGALQDVSLEGAALRQQSDGLLYPGLLVPEVEVTAGPQAGLRLAGAVCHVTESDRGQTCGLRLQATDQDGERGWAEEVARALYPRTRKTQISFHQLWDLYGHCGYLNIAGSNETEFAEVKRHAANATAKLEASPAVGAIVAWPSRRGLDGALTAVRPYSRTWFGMQMAKRTGRSAGGWPGRLVLRDLHMHIYEQAQHDSSIEWILAYVREDAGWPRLVHSHYQRHCAQTGLACVNKFRAVRVSTPRVVLHPSDDVEVGEANDDELSRLLESIALSRSEAYVLGLDLDRDQARFQSVGRLWREAGLTRERTILVARSRGQVVAGGIFELGDEGIHLYGLLDAARIYPIDSVDPAAVQALVRSGAEWFRSHGKTSFVLFDESLGRLPLPPELEHVDMGRADQSLISVELIPDMMEWVWEITAADVVAP